MNKATIYSDDPVEIAMNWFNKGAEKLHIVDLDGAIKGYPANKKIIENIVKSIPIPIQIGGGIRNIADIATSNWQIT